MVVDVRVAVGPGRMAAEADLARKADAVVLVARNVVAPVARIVPAAFPKRAPSSSNSENAKVNSVVKANSEVKVANGAVKVVAAVSTPKRSPKCVRRWKNSPRRPRSVDWRS